MKELNINEMKSINGGVSFAFRIGQAIRGVILCQTIGGCLQFQMEVEVNKVLGD